MTEYTIDDIKKELKIQHRKVRSRCFNYYTIQQGSKFWDIRNEIGKDRVKDELKISVWKDQEKGWMVRIPNGKCPMEGFQHDIKHWDCLYFHEFPSRRWGKTPFEYGFVDDITKEGIIRGKYAVKLPYIESTITRTRRIFAYSFFPVYEEENIEKKVVTRELPKEEEDIWKGWYPHHDLPDKCYDVSMRNRNKNENWIKDLKIST